MFSINEQVFVDWTIHDQADDLQSDFFHSPVWQLALSEYLLLRRRAQSCGTRNRFYQRPRLPQRNVSTRSRQSLAVPVGISARIAEGYWLGARSVGSVAAGGKEDSSTAIRPSPCSGQSRRRRRVSSRLVVCALDRVCLSHFFLSPMTSTSSEDHGELHIPSRVTVLSTASRTRVHRVRRPVADGGNGVVSSRQIG